MTADEENLQAYQEDTWCAGARMVPCRSVEQQGA